MAYYVNPKGIVEYRIRNRKRPIAYSHPATLHFLILLQEEYPNHTIQQLMDIISSKEKFIPNYDAMEVLSKYIEKGQGNNIPHWVK